MSNLVKILNDIPVVATIDLWKGLEVEHRAIISLIKKYENEFQSIRLFTFRMLKGTGGRPMEYCYLDEEQTTFLITLMRNSYPVVVFKLKLTKEFYRMKRELANIASQKQNAQWLETRNGGKQVRRVETDTVKKFIEYAINQGSTKAKHYYSNITSMQNKALFLIEQKFNNIRDILNLQQLSTVICADEIVTKALDDGMAKNMTYQDIYKLAKKRIELFAEVHGKTLIPNFSEQKQIEKNKTIKKVKKVEQLSLF